MGGNGYIKDDINDTRFILHIMIDCESRCITMVLLHDGNKTKNKQQIQEFENPILNIVISLTSLVLIMLRI